MNSPELPNCLLGAQAACDRLSLGIDETLQEALGAKPAFTNPDIEATETAYRATLGEIAGRLASVQHCVTCPVHDTIRRLNQEAEKNK